MFRSFLLITLSVFPITAQALYQWQDEHILLELRGLFRTIGIAANNPNDMVLFDRDKILTGGSFGRLMLDLHTSNVSFEVHMVQSYIEPALRTGGSRTYTQISDDRSDALYWQFADRRAELTFDRLNMQIGNENLTITLGRQPINLAATYYFSPNDFFSPFSAQTFYRTYKSGVDAAKLNWQWDELSQLSIYAVLTYPLDNEDPDDRLTHPDWSQTSVLARASTLINSFEWAVLSGQEHGDYIIGIDFQGELFEWLEIRGEGHLRFPDKNRSRDAKFSLGLEHRWRNSLALRLEQFYQRSGKTENADYIPDPIADSTTFYSARNYTALGASYTLNPLLILDAVWLFNHNYSSHLLSLYSSYSLSNDSELATGINIPIGDLPENGQPKSEFGRYPKLISVEYRIYF